MPRPDRQPRGTVRPATPRIPRIQAMPWSAPGSRRYLRSPSNDATRSYESLRTPDPGCRTSTLPEMEVGRKRSADEIPTTLPVTAVCPGSRVRSASLSSSFLIGCPSCLTKDLSGLYNCFRYGSVFAVSCPAHWIDVSCPCRSGRRRTGRGCLRSPPSPRPGRRNLVRFPYWVSALLSRCADDG